MRLILIHDILLWVTTVCTASSLHFITATAITVNHYC